MSKKAKKNVHHKQAENPTPLIAILVETSNSWGRGVIQGISNYERQHGTWQLFLDPQSTGLEEGIRVPEGFEGQGIIAAVRSRKMVDQLKQLNVPVVNVSGVQIPGVVIPTVTNDPVAVVQMAVNHLHEDCALKNLAFCGEPSRKFINFWENSFRFVMSEYNIEPIIYKPSKGITHRSGFAAKQKDRQRWINELSKPIGILCWDTVLSRKLVSACDGIGIKVPDEVAIISMETEDLLGEIAHPPISGVTLALERVGYTAAEMLDVLLKKPLSEPEIILIPPLYVTARRSTNIYAVEDPRLGEALSWIRDHACESVTVNDLLKQVPVARRVLERLFKKFLNTTPATEIARHRLRRIKELLVKTNMPIPKVATACGFTYVESMITFFRKKEGLSPLAFRKKMHGK